MLAGALTKAVQPNASIASTGLSIRYIGDHAYAYSGVVAVDNNETALIDTVTGSGYAKLVWDCSYSPDAYSTDRYTFKLYLNDLLSYVEFHYDNNLKRAFSVVLIPPLTKLKITAQNLTDTSSQDCLTILTGRVYGVE